MSPAKKPEKREASLTIEETVFTTLRKSEHVSTEVVVLHFPPDVTDEEFIGLRDMNGEGAKGQTYRLPVSMVGALIDALNQIVPQESEEVKRAREIVAGWKPGRGRPSKEVQDARRLLGLA